MRNYALIWNKSIERYELFDLRDSKRQNTVLGEVSADKIVDWLFEKVCQSVGREANDQLASDPETAAVVDLVNKGLVSFNAALGEIIGPAAEDSEPEDIEDYYGLDI